MLTLSRAALLGGFFMLAGCAGAERQALIAVGIAAGDTFARGYVDHLADKHSLTDEQRRSAGILVGAITDIALRANAPRTAARFSTLDTDLERQLVVESVEARR